MRRERFGAGILFICQGKILLILRSPLVPAPNLWAIPGGGVDDDDKTIWDAAKREVREELGSFPERCRVITKKVVKSGTFAYTTFVVVIEPKVRDQWEIQLNWENTQAAWFDPSKLPANLHPGLKTIL